MRLTLTTFVLALYCSAAGLAQDACSIFNRNLGPFQTIVSDTKGHITGNHTLINYIRASCSYTQEGYCDAVSKAQSVTAMTEGGKLTLGFVHETATGDSNGIATATYPSLAISHAKGAGGVKECFASCAFSATVGANGSSVTFSATPTWSKEVAYDNTCPAHKTVVNSCSGTSLTGLPINPCGPSPILIDTRGQAFRFSGYVTFRFGGQLKKVSWPDWKYENGWLALPKNGVVDSADDLFGNYTKHSDADYTPFPNKTDSNGWLALAFYDQPSQGGNGDGVLDKKDAIWKKLKVWKPKHCHLNPDQPCVALDSELFRLDALGIHSLSLTYTAVDQLDAIGNQCSFVASVNPDAGQRQRSRDNKIACDFNLAEKK